MNEARRVLDRLERIDALRRAQAPAGQLLVEVRSLLREGESWLATEREEGTEAAWAALERCRARLRRDTEVVREGAL